MADNLNIPTESWRPHRRPSLLDPQIARLAVIAAGVVGVVVLGFAGYAVLGHRPHTVPVVEADARPIRVRPDNPGGLQVVGADELVGTGGTEAMASPPEAPAPEALRAKIRAELQAAAQPATAPMPPAPRPVSMVSPPPDPPVQISSMPEQRAPAAKATPPARIAPAKPAPTKVGPAAAGTQVQLAALESEQAARTEWQRLSQRMPELLAAHQPAVLRTERDGRVFYRLRTGGFTDQDSATAFCAQIRSKGADCSIASF